MLWKCWLYLNLSDSQSLTTPQNLSYELPTNILVPLHSWSSKSGSQISVKKTRTEKKLVGVSRLRTFQKNTTQYSWSFLAWFSKFITKALNGLLVVLDDFQNSLPGVRWSFDLVLQSSWWKVSGSVEFSPDFRSSSRDVDVLSYWFNWRVFEVSRKVLRFVSGKRLRFSIIIVASVLGGKEWRNFPKKGQKCSHAGSLASLQSCPWTLEVSKSTYRQTETPRPRHPERFAVISVKPVLLFHQEFCCPTSQTLQKFANFSMSCSKQQWWSVRVWFLKPARP